MSPFLILSPSLELIKPFLNFLGLLGSQVDSATHESFAKSFGPLTFGKLTLLVDGHCTTVTEVVGDSTTDTEANEELPIFTEAADESFTITVVPGD